MVKRCTCLAAMAVLALIGVSGCGEEKGGIEVCYSRPAQYPIPETVRTIAVMPFSGQDVEGKRWGEVASDKLAVSLQEASRKFSRYQLVDRRRLKEMLDERDMQIAMGGNPEAVNKAGKLVNAQAILYGNIRVTPREERSTRQQMDRFSQTMRTVEYVRRTCSVSMSFTMNDPMNGKMLATGEFTRNYDSAKKSGGFSEMFGIGGDDASKLPSVEQVVNDLIDEGVQQFVATISPHEVRFTERLEKGKNKLVATGNKLALAGDSQGALELYEQALAATPNDDGAAFNAGLMHEQLKNTDQALKMYKQAISLKDKPKYIQASQRLRKEVGSAE